ncbi:ABC transporter ATP-binding protein [Falsiroseomonas oryzae]|uniref:ABC transporter ATP-binding protein n=1 Tax=Falsiroseomonas oryzae TaxID=2766473 RepID=UPI0022EB8B8B|nr:ABC transporter ATP-binding protein [Roseomonas sp. MO-31]
MATITCERITKRYGGVVAVDALDLTIRHGEFMVLLGPSGCGKTTTLNMIAGLEEISEGRLLFDDKDVTWQPPHKREVAMVFQSYALYPNKTVRENIAFPLQLRRTPREEITRAVTEVAEQLEIGHLLDRRPSQLSGGQRQRVALGRAIVRKPSVFLMDEPLSNLDATLRLSMRSLIKHLHHRLRATFVYVTHDQAEAMTLADRIAVMKGGLVQQLDTPEGIYARPANTFVAAFLGSPQINLVQGEIAPDGSFARGAFRLALPPGAAQPGRAVTLGLRPEDVGTLAPGLARLEARVDLVSPLGSETHLEVVAGDDVKLTLRVPKEWRAQEGQVIAVGVDPARLHLFDATTDARL